MHAVYCPKLLRSADFCWVSSKIDEHGGSIHSSFIHWLYTDNMSLAARPSMPSKPCIQMSFSGMSIWISSGSVNWISWPRTHVVWLRPCIQGTGVPPRELWILFKQIASVKSDLSLKPHLNTRFATPSPCVPGPHGFDMLHIAPTTRREDLAAELRHYKTVR